jgi:hypothetical protein
MGISTENESSKDELRPLPPFFEFEWALRTSMMGIWRLLLLVTAPVL